jgi:hypothetical protein
MTAFWKGGRAMSLSSRALRRSVQAAAVAAVGLIIALAGIVPAAQASAAPRWRFDKTITPARGSDWLYSVVATSRSDAWAAGDNYTDGATRARLLVEHYNGHRWRQVAIPADLTAVNPTADIEVGASSPANVWVFELLAGHKQRILRWDGRRWHLATAPSWVLRGNPADLNGQPGQGVVAVAVQSRSSAWVFSIGTNDQPSEAAREVDGRWHLVPLPGVPADVAAVSDNDIWASGTNASGQPIIMHWNGHRWTSHAAPAGGIGPITADSSNSAWVLTSDAVEYWNGTAWTAIALPSFVGVWEIATDGHGGVWLWGLHSNGDSLYSPNLFAHYSDGSWSVKNAPAINGNNYAQLAALEQVPGSTTVFGVGWVGLSSTGPSGAIMRYGT